jgi:hypothetical protein
MRTLTSLIPAALAGAALALVAGAASAQPTPLPLNHEAIVGGVGIGCTGIGQTKNAPRWNAYSVKVEFADTARGLLADETMTLSAGGAHIATVTCEGPWILLKLPPGKPYQVSGAVPGTTATETTTVTAPAHGQGVFALTFPVAQ